MSTANFLIVGAGLAGCLMAWRLSEAGEAVTVFGDNSGPSASMVAGGVINPVTGRWSVKSWRIDDLLPEAEACYRAIEAKLKISIYHQIPLIRYCRSNEDVKRIGRRMRNPRYADVLGPFREPGSGPKAIKDTHGSYEIRKAAFVDLPKLLTSMRSYLQVIDQSFEHSQLKAVSGAWHYKGINADRVIFCEGAALKENPYTAQIPLTPIKGETLLLSNEELQLPRGLYHHEKWLLPYGDGTFRLGATYNEQDISHVPTQAGASELKQGLNSFISSDFVEINHLAGLRPATPDARPILGQLPDHRGLYVFNGLGSKGASVAPLMSHHLIDHLLENTSLYPDVDMTRFLEQLR